MEISHAASCYKKNQLPSLTSSSLVLFGNVTIKQGTGPPTTICANEYNVLFPRNKEVKVGMERLVYDKNNQPKRATFKYYQEGQFFLV